MHKKLNQKAVLSYSGELNGRKSRLLPATAISSPHADASQSATSVHEAPHRPINSRLVAPLADSAVLILHQTIWLLSVLTGCPLAFLLALHTQASRIGSAEPFGAGQASSSCASPLSSGSCTEVMVDNCWWQLALQGFYESAYGRDPKCIIPVSHEWLVWLSPLQQPVIRDAVDSAD